MKTAGLLSSHVDSVEAYALDSKYVLVKTVWRMNLRANNGEEVTRKTSATYVLSDIGDSFEIVLQLDHQDLMKIVHDLSWAGRINLVSENALCSRPFLNSPL
jgi:hypothetical protein